ncbi:DEAD/DEAH box helicase [Micromonospora echinofusca]|uniref:DEAD/DEAH box helicase n=1 Tax=Micromonospora echinofusca TaxID=47858 RepID=UPI0027DC19EF|nr:DEAD/DEAH box helicase [Micromonospora echinofusca]
MLVFHGVWLPEAAGLALWAEDPALPARPPRRPGRPPRERPHPYAAGHAELLATLLEGGADRLGGAGDDVRDVAGKAVSGSIGLALPTRGGAPVDSPELVRTADPDPQRGPVTLAAWRVATLEYDVDDALTLLRGLPGTGLPTGAGLRHLAATVDLAVDLVSRGRVLPGVEAPDRGPTVVGPPGVGRAGGGRPDGRAGNAGRVPGRAVWRPLLTGADAEWARALAMALPPAVRAAVPELPAGALLADVLDRLTDAAARTALDGVRLAEPERGEPSRGADRRAGPTGAGVHRPGPVVTGWLGALTGRQRTFTAPAAALATLATELADWQRDAAGSAVRGCFRLVEPAAQPDLFDQAADAAADGDSWRVTFGLQAADEPGLVATAGDVWAQVELPPGLAGRLAAPQETLLTELGRASRLWPELDTALRTATPEALELDTEGAHRFLREGAPLLHAAGFGVLLPGWWGRPAARLGARLQARSRTAPGTVATASGLDTLALVDYRWEVALGDQPLTAEELAALAEAKTPLVRLRGQWVELDPRRLRAGLRLLRSAGRSTVAELLHLARTVQDDPQAPPVLAVTADGALGDLLAGRAEQRLTALDEPPGFTGTLRPYQRRGYAWLAFLASLGLGGVLADDMGLGKTVQLLALFAADPPDAGPTLLVCPVSLVGNWQREAARFTPGLRVHVHHGAERARGDRFAEAAGGADLVLTTYAVAARDAAELAGVDWHRVVVDEAQAIRNAATRQAEAVRAIPARHRIAVTGTPVENRLADLWSIMEFTNPGLLGGAAGFRKRYAEPIERHGDDAAAERLRRLTGPFLLRRLKTDASIISDLPEKLEMEVLCNLTTEQAALYQAVVDDMLARIESTDGIERRGLVLATMTKLKQVCNHPAQLLRDGSALPGRSGKLARLEEILDEVLAAGEKALLFTQYAEFGRMLRGHLSARTGREVLYLHGGVGKAERDALVSRFQSDGGPPLFVLSLKAGGTGLTLTAANHVVHVDRWWNPAVEDQATDRAFRIGQRRRVQVRKFVCAGTVEERIAELVGTKRGLAARVVGTGEQWLTGLSTGELREVLSLRPGTVVG